MTADVPLMLIEPYAHRLGGHHQYTLVALARSRPGSLVIAPCGIAAEASTALRKDRVRIVTGVAGPVAAVLLAAAKAAALLSAAVQRVFASRRWPTCLRRLPHQVTLLTRCLTEAACLRTARRLTVGRTGAVVVLSASEALHGTAVLLGGLPHLRFIHEAVTTEDLPLRLLGALTRRGEAKVLALYPTAAVHTQVAPIFPHLPGALRAFTVDDGARLTAAEHGAACAAFDIPDDERAVCLVGGWWPYKDIATIDAALTRLRYPLHLLVVGTPLDEAVLTRWQTLPTICLHTIPGPVSEQVLRDVYAAADAALVARHPGVGKESGLVMDAVRLGVPLIVSAHDPDLTALLAGRDWAWLFPAGDADTLAQVLDRLAAGVPERPGADAPRLLDMLPAAEQAAFLTAAYTRLLAKEH